VIAVVAPGGNALARRGELLDIESQRRNVNRAAAGVELPASQHTVVLTHGNGPQVGVLALQRRRIPAPVRTRSTSTPKPKA
jgi:carbamate kinase